jgi:hypothetical protein
MVRASSSSGEDKKVECNTKEGTTLKLELCNCYEQLATKQQATY